MEAGLEASGFSVPKFIDIVTEKYLPPVYAINSPNEMNNGNHQCLLSTKIFLKIYCGLIFRSYFFINSSKKKNYVINDFLKKLG
jgi:hypothetical protein